MAKKGKRLKKAYEGINPEAAACESRRRWSRSSRGASAKFDETIEIAMNLNIDPRKQDQKCAAR